MRPGRRKRKMRALESSSAMRVNRRRAALAWWPERGPCAFCGGPDARHRIWDALASRYRGGDRLEDLAVEFDAPLISVMAAAGVV